jgi:hypothetical protein
MGEWVADDASRERSRLALELIEANQAARCRRCPCGQLTNNPSGVCSRSTEEHRRIVAESRWR